MFTVKRRYLLFARIQVYSLQLRSILQERISWTERDKDRNPDLHAWFSFLGSNILEGFHSSLLGNVRHAPWRQI